MNVFSANPTRNYSFFGSILSPLPGVVGNGPNLEEHLVASSMVALAWWCCEIQFRRHLCLLATRSYSTSRREINTMSHCFLYCLLVFILNNRTLHNQVSIRTFNENYRSVCQISVTCPTILHSRKQFDPIVQFDMFNCRRRCLHNASTS